MEQVLDLPVVERKELDYAGFGIRFVAIIIDGIILQLALVLASLAIYGDYSFANKNLLLTAISLVMNFTYNVWMTSSNLQATLGKMAVGIKVGDAEGKQISMGTSIGRYFSHFLSALIFLIGYLMVIWDARKQGLHDKIMNTYVFKA